MVGPLLAGDLVNYSESDYTGTVTQTEGGGPGGGEEEERRMQQLTLGDWDRSEFTQLNSSSQSEHSNLL